MPELDISKLEGLFSLPPATSNEQDILLPYTPDPLLISAENIADILSNFNEE